MFDKLASELTFWGIDFIKTADISSLPVQNNLGYQRAVLLGLHMSEKYVYRLSKEKIFDYIEFWAKERVVDNIAEWAAAYIQDKGYRAYAQSEKNNKVYGYYNGAIRTSTLPHKTIAMLSGSGWIGKNSLLITPEYGSAICMCTVLTDAPIPIEKTQYLSAKCGQCRMCQTVCPTKVIHGNNWDIDANRDQLVDVYNCKQCLKCMVECPWTQKYMNNALNSTNSFRQDGCDAKEDKQFFIVTSETKSDFIKYDKYFNKHKELVIPDQYEQSWVTTYQDRLLEQLKIYHGSMLDDVCMNLCDSISLNHRYDYVKLMIAFLDENIGKYDVFTSLRLCESILKMSLYVHIDKSNHEIHMAYNKAMQWLKTLLTKPVIIDESYKEDTQLSEILTEEYIIERINKNIREYDNYIFQCGGARGWHCDH